MTGTTNPFFSNYKVFGEQELMRDLNDEAIRIYGEDMWFIPRVLYAHDPIRGEDVGVSTYEHAYQIPVYIESFDRFQGDGSFISKFAGLEIRDQVTFAISMRTFAEEVGSQTGQVRPNEGDLLYFPLNDKCFQIRNTVKFEVFYPLGSLYTWQVQCELFEYTGEKFSTGIPEIDKLNLLTPSLVDTSIQDSNNEVLTSGNNEGITWAEVKPAIDESNDFTEAANTIIDFSEEDPFSEGFFSGNTS